MDYGAAKRIQNRLIEVLTPDCVLIHPAGSIRRCCNEASDIEIVCQPKTEKAQADLFEQGMIISPGFVNTVMNVISDNIISGNCGGRMMKLIVRGTAWYSNPDLAEYGGKGMKLDLFMPRPHDYFRQYAIRTGSADYSRRIAGAWVKLGWVGTEDGLRRKDQCKEVSKNKYACIVKEPTIPPVWKSEEEFFEWVQMKWLDPKQRV